MLSDDEKEKIRNIDPLEEDWYSCINCNCVVVLPQKNFLAVVSKRGKHCGDCIVSLEKERIKAIKRDKKLLRQSEQPLSPL